jgi:hypothetical protein
MRMEITMDPLSTVRDLEGAAIVASTESAWGPSGTLGLANPGISGDKIVFDVLVPTTPNDIWDYIWQSEKDRQSTEKVQLFQEGARITGSRVTAISREGQSERWNAVGPEQYRLTFRVPAAAVKPDAPIEVRFFWDDKVMSTASKS